MSLTKKITLFVFAALVLFSSAQRASAQYQDEYQDVSYFEFYVGFGLTVFEKPVFGSAEVKPGDVSVTETTARMGGEGFIGLRLFPDVPILGSIKLQYASTKTYLKGYVFSVTYEFLRYRSLLNPYIGYVQSSGFNKAYDSKGFVVGVNYNFVSIPVGVYIEHKDLGTVSLSKDDERVRRGYQSAGVFYRIY